MTSTSANKGSEYFGWIALYTKPNLEGTAVKNVERQGYQAYCPMVMRRRSHARQVDIVRRPLFPCYVFVRIDGCRARWRPLLSTIGVRSVVRFGEQLGFLPEGLVEDLQTYEQANLLQQQNTPQFEPGESVRVTDGLFQNLIAEVLSTSENNRVWLLLDIMGRAVRSQHDAWHVQSCRTR
ncbi:transcription termination/antitermination protein NusG [Roseibium sediminis]|uniref:transcription termination/antitermination protein NusG n=1 Tax=Roseibium sediminis TaxID=1775174 RepID=UPI00123DC3E4|nr:transcription termination/antitermination NusG family protein [Roseibium sediminis]